MLTKIFLCLTLLFSGGQMQSNSITNYFSKASAITIIENGTKTSYLKGDDKFEEILTSLLKITSGAHDMPAYGVSLDKDTKKATESGLWLELEFKTPETFNELPFESLLFEVSANYEGFNLIRKNNNTYDGRCFYLNLKGNMKHLFATLKNISK